MLTRARVHSHTHTTALDLRTFVVGRGSLLVCPPNSKVALTECKIISESQHGIVTFTADKAVLVPGEPKWANYVKGVVSEYLKDVPPGRFFGCFVCVCVCVCIYVYSFNCP